MVLPLRADLIRLSLAIGASLPGDSFWSAPSAFIAPRRRDPNPRSCFEWHASDMSLSQQGMFSNAAAGPRHGPARRYRSRCGDAPIVTQSRIWACVSVPCNPCEPFRRSAWRLCPGRVRVEHSGDRLRHRRAFERIVVVADFAPRMWCERLRSQISGSFSRR